MTECALCGKQVPFLSEGRLCNNCEKSTTEDMDLMRYHGITCRKCHGYNPYGMNPGHRRCVYCSDDLWGGDDQLFPIAEKTQSPQRLRFENRVTLSVRHCIICGKEVIMACDSIDFSGPPICNSKTCEKIYKFRLPPLPTNEGIKKPVRLGTTCEILAEHHDLLKDDPERLSTDFIKSMSGIKRKACKEVGD